MHAGVPLSPCGGGVSSRGFAKPAIPIWTVVQKKLWQRFKLCRRTTPLFNLWGGGVHGDVEARSQNCDSFLEQVSPATKLMQADVVFSTCGGGRVAKGVRETRRLDFGSPPEQASPAIKLTHAAAAFFDLCWGGVFSSGSRSQTSRFEGTSRTGSASDGRPTIVKIYLFMVGPP